MSNNSKNQSSVVTSLVIPMSFVVYRIIPWLVLVLLITQTSSARTSDEDVEETIPDMIMLLKEFIEPNFNVRTNALFITSTETGGDDMICVPVPRPKPKPEPKE